MAKRAIEEGHYEIISKGSFSAGPSTKKSKSLLEPISVWKTFPRLKLAMEYSITCFQDVAIFSYESSGTSVCESASPGIRRFLVTTYYEFGKRYILMKPPKHFYEVITEGTACHLYFDLEYSIKLNPNTDPLKVLEVFKLYVSCQLKHVFNISCGLEHILDLDSTTKDKFSRHLIYHLEDSAFRNNQVVGHFVKYICDRLRALKDSFPAAIEYKDVIHLNRRGPACICPPAAELLQLFVNTSKGTGLICDESVYTRNRSFRLLLSTKKGKDAKLRVAKESVYKSSYRVEPTKRKWSAMYNNLMDSLICNVRFEITSVILDNPFNNQQCLPLKPALPGHSPIRRNTVSNRSRDEMAAGGKVTAGDGSPYPMIDQFITSKLVKDGLTGRIRKSTYFSQGKQILYEITGYRWCENIGRHHKSNNIMIIVDLKDSSYYQKCHDSDCKRINFRSNKYPIPSDIIGLCDIGEDHDTSISMLDRDLSEMKRMMLSDFTGNDSFNDNIIGNLTATDDSSEEQTLQPTTEIFSEQGSRYTDSGNKEVFEQLLELDGHDNLDRDLSYYDIFGEGLPLSSKEFESSHYNDTGTEETTGEESKFSKSCSQDSSQDSISNSPWIPIKQSTSTGSHSTSTPKSRTRRVKSAHKIGRRRRLVKTEPVDYSRDDCNETSTASLSQGEMKSFLESDDDLLPSNALRNDESKIDIPVVQMKMNSFHERKSNSGAHHKPAVKKEPHYELATVKKEPVDDEIEDSECLDLSQNEMASFLDEDSDHDLKEVEQPLDRMEDNLLNLSQQEMDSFLQDPDTDESDSLLNLSQQEMNSFLHNSDDMKDGPLLSHQQEMDSFRRNNKLVKEEPLDRLEDNMLNLSQQEMTSFLQDSCTDDRAVKREPLSDSTEENMLNLSQQEMDSFLQGSTDDDVSDERDSPLLNLSQQEMVSFLQDSNDDAPVDHEPLNLSQQEMNSFLQDDD